MKCWGVCGELEESCRNLRAKKSHPKVALIRSRKNYFFSPSAAGAAGAAAGVSAAGAGAAGAAAGASAAGAGGVSFLPQATKAAANKVAKRSDFFMGVP
jgi:hypothetical protein